MLQQPSFRRRAFTGAAVLLIASAGLGLYTWLNPAFAGPTRTPAQAHAEAVAGEIILIDIRRPDEWRATGIGVGAQPLDMRSDDFEAQLLALAEDRDTPIALICAAGVRTARLANRLTEAGFTNIIDVPEGMTGSSAGPGWIAAGLPLMAMQ